MALLLRDREAASDAAPRSPDGDVRVASAALACEACGAAMQRGQDWCLECGAAAPGRLGARPGWRAAFTVVGLTLLLVCGAVIASYAALTTDAQRTAAAPSSGSADPIVAQTPPVAQPPALGAVPPPPGATGPGTTPPAVTPGVIPGAGPLPIIPTPSPAVPATNTPVAPAPPVPPVPAGTAPTGQAPPATGTKPTPATGANGAPAAAAPAAPRVIKLKPGAARTYDPAKRAGAEFGPAAQAIDAKPDTVWDVVVPADGLPLGVGLMVDLGAPHALDSLRITTPTPGFRVELYGAVDAKELPEDILDKRWIHLTDRRAAVDGKVISLKGKGDGVKVQAFLMHFTLAAERNDPRVAIGDVELRGAP